ncbi:MAG: helix-turn-helix domain-containing protein, partial [Desulfovibrionaceae bacterium]
MNISKEFGKRMRSFRAARGLTQLELGERLGVTMQYVGQLERGVSTPSFKLLRTICRVLAVKPAALFLFPQSGEGEDRSEPPESLAAGKGMWRMEMGSGELKWTAQMRRMLGLASGPAKPSLELLLRRVHQADRSWVEQAFADLQAGEPMNDLAFRVMHGDRPRLMLATADVVRENGGAAAWGVLL